MFFNCCRRNCCCRQGGSTEKNWCNKYDYDRCDKRDDKCDKHEDKHDKCDWEKKEKCCCHLNYEKRCCYDKRNEQFDNYPTQNGGYGEQYSQFDGQNHFGEYNNLGYFNQQNTYGCEKDEIDKPCRIEDDYHHDFDKHCYIPNWDNDKNCKCEKDNHKCDKKEDKYRKPVKYICIPFDKY